MKVSPVRTRDVFAVFQGGLVVSCMARPGNPLHGPEPMTMMARAAELGGAKGLRANGPADVAALLRATSLPVIAINRVDYPDSAVTITPTIADTMPLLDAGASVIALDATNRRRPFGETLRDQVQAIHAAGAIVLGDLSSLADLDGALAARVDAVGTTLSGYTGPAPARDEPDFALLSELVRRSPVPVYAEGRYWTTEQVVQAFRLGAAFAVVGTAITNPMAITSRFVGAIDRWQRGREDE